MSERAEALREVIADAAWQTLPEGERGGYVARAICEHLGLTWEMVEDVEMGEVLLGYGYDSKDSPLEPVRRLLATLLEAAGIER